MAKRRFARGASGPMADETADWRWDWRFVDLAAHIASWSKDPSTRVGSVIVRPDRTIASVGYNGFPRGVQDAPERYADRPTKYLMVVHAEMNAILAASESLRGHTLYVHPLCPCSTCAAAIIQAGIVRVVTVPPTGDIDRWQESFQATQTMFREAGVKLDYLNRASAA